MIRTGWWTPSQVRVYACLYRRRNAVSRKSIPPRPHFRFIFLTPGLKGQITQKKKTAATDAPSHHCSRAERGGRSAEHLPRGARHLHQNGRDPGAPQADVARRASQDWVDRVPRRATRVQGGHAHRQVGGEPAAQGVSGPPLLPRVVLHGRGGVRRSAAYRAGAAHRRGGARWGLYVKVIAPSFQYRNFRTHSQRRKVESSCDPWLETAWFQPLKLKCDILVSKFALSNSTCTATPRGAAGHRRGAVCAGAAHHFRRRHDRHQPEPRRQSAGLPRVHIPRGGAHGAAAR
jgi:hypothetical protein